MSRRHWRERIGDILSAVEEIRSFTRDMDQASFAEDARTQKAVLADFSIIGEAAAHVPDAIVAAHPEIPWRDMREMRNFVVHVYFSVDSAILWTTIQDDLPTLAVALTALLRSGGGDPLGAS